MKITILTLFPEMFTALKESIIGRAEESGKLQINIVNIRDYAENKHFKCDDYPFGGGAGMVMMPQPIGSCIEAVDPDHNAHRILMSPRGKTFTQKKAKELSLNGEILLLCGHYEGVDQRVTDLFMDEEISIGDYVLTGGEIPAMAVCDCISRLVDGVISRDSLTDESFSDGFLEYPQYTRPAEYKGAKVPDVLLSGDHSKVDEWRKWQSRKITEKVRPDLLPNQVHTMPDLTAVLDKTHTSGELAQFVFYGQEFFAGYSYGYKKKKPRPVIYKNGYTAYCLNGLCGRFETQTQLFAFLGVSAGCKKESFEYEYDDLKELFEAFPECDGFSLGYPYRGVKWQEYYDLSIERYSGHKRDRLTEMMINSIDDDGVVHFPAEELNTPEYAPFKRYLQRVTVNEGWHGTGGGTMAKTFYFKLTPYLKAKLMENENLYNGKLGLKGLALYQNGILRYYEIAGENRYVTINLK